MKKESVSNTVKNMMIALRGMVKRKGRALKARLIIYSLLAQTNFLVSSIPLTTVTHHHQNHCQLQPLEVEEAEAEAEAEAKADLGIRIPTSTGGSVIEMVKNSKEEAGEEFNLEKDIDDVADLFIKNFHRQIRMQKQEIAIL